MGFIAKHFSFDHVPCEKYGLRIFDIDSNNNIATPFASSGELQTDTIPSKGKTFLYGRSLNKPLEFSLVFGIDPSRVAMNDYFDRYEMNAIATWLIGHNTYKWLEIEQPDLEMIRYHCIIRDLEPIQLSWLPWAFSHCSWAARRKGPLRKCRSCWERKPSSSTIPAKAGGSLRPTTSITKNLAGSL